METVTLSVEMTVIHSSLFLSSYLFPLTPGSWSLAPVPQCELVTCPPLEVTSAHLRLLTLNNSFLGAATFSCPLGYSLSPSIPSIWCDHTGAWSAPLPTCQVVR